MINDQGETPLFVAEYWGRDEVMKYLIAKGADTDTTDSRGSSPLGKRNRSASTSSSSSIRVGDSETALLRFKSEGAIHDDVVGIQTTYRDGNKIYTATNGKVSSIQVLPEK